MRGEINKYIQSFKKELGSVDTRWHQILSVYIFNQTANIDRHDKLSGLLLQSRVAGFLLSMLNSGDCVSRFTPPSSASDQI